MTINSEAGAAHPQPTEPPEDVERVLTYLSRQMGDAGYCNYQACREFLDQAYALGESRASQLNEPFKAGAWLDEFESTVRIYRHKVHGTDCECRDCIVLLKALASLPSERASQPTEGGKPPANDPATKYPVPVVCAYIERDRKILLERRAPTGIIGLDRMWDLPGGKVEIGETPEQAVIREIREEMGIEIEVLSLIPALKKSAWDYGKGVRHWLVIPYRCRIIKGEPHITDNLQWKELNELSAENTLTADLEIIRAAHPEPTEPHLQQEVEAWRLLAKQLKRQVGINENSTQAEYIWTIDKLLKIEREARASQPTEGSHQSLQVAIDGLIKAESVVPDDEVSLYQIAQVREIADKLDCKLNGLDAVNTKISGQNNSDRSVATSKPEPIAAGEPILIEQLEFYANPSNWENRNEYRAKDDCGDLGPTIAGWLDAKTALDKYRARSSQPAAQEHVHYPACNASRRVPIGTKGAGCICVVTCKSEWEELQRKVRAAQEKK